MDASAWISSIVVGLGTGILSALISWWMLTRLMRARLAWRNGVARYRLSDSPDEKYRYAVALRNPSRRDAVDINLVVRLRVPGLIRPKGVEVIPLRTEWIPVVNAKREVSSRVRLEMVDDDTRRRFATALPQPFRDQWAAGASIDLTELMLALTGSTITVWAFGSDKYTWARAVAFEEFTVEEFIDVWGPRDLPEKRPRGRARSLPPDVPASPDAADGVGL